MSTTTNKRRRPSPAAQAKRDTAREQLAAQLHTELTAKVAQMAQGERWTEFLRFCASFHSYSAKNLLLIMAQYPTATHIAGFEEWKKRGRSVRKGEKAIRIFGYSTRTIRETDPDSGEETRHKIPRYPILTVFDIAQTDPIPGAPQPDDLAPVLTGEDPTQIYDRAAAALTARGWTVQRKPLPGKHYGSTTLTGPRVVTVDSDAPPAQAAKTVLHEFGHVLLLSEPMREAGTPTPDAMVRHRGLEETEAESVAYIVAAMCGLDTSAYSVGYITAWTEGDTALIEATAHRVRQAALTIAAALTGQDHPADQ